MNDLLVCHTLDERGGWLQTYTGAAFYPAQPAVEDVRIEDIAHGLSRLCRYGGHCIRFYSVAEHCVLMAEKAPDEIKLAVLMHDAPEAYLGDVVRPLKRLLPEYSVIEERVARCIARRFTLPHPMPPEVKQLDNAIIGDERVQNMGRPPRPWLPSEGLGVELRFWTPEKASYEFLTAFYRYGGHYN